MSFNVYYLIDRNEIKGDVGRYSTREASAQKIFASVRLLGLTVSYCVHCNLLYNNCDSLCS